MNYEARGLHSGSVKRPVSPELRQQVIDLRRRMSLKQVAEQTGLALGTVKTIMSRSGAFRDNELHRAVFCLPPLKPSTETQVALKELPTQQIVTGDRDVDALLWLREVVGTGQAGHIEAAMAAAKKIKTPAKELEKRYRDWLQITHPNNLFAALSSFNLSNLESLARKSVEKAELQAEARARFGDLIFSDTDAEVFCAVTLDGLECCAMGMLDKAEVAKRFKAKPDLMPNTLADCLRELDYWNRLYWMRNAVDRDLGDAAPEATARDWFVFDLLGEIRPRNRDEAKAVLSHLVTGGRADSMKDCNRIMENLLG